MFKPDPRLSQANHRKVARAVLVALTGVACRGLLSLDAWLVHAKNRVKPQALVERRMTPSKKRQPRLGIRSKRGVVGEPVREHLRELRILVELLARDGFRD